MKKPLLSMVALIACCLSVFAASYPATITSAPAPAILGQPVTITVKLTSHSFAGDAYLYSWIIINENGAEKKYEAAKWDDTNVDKYKMTKIDNSTFSFTISDMADFWHIDGAVLSSLKELKLNFIAKSGDDQTVDLDVTAKQPEKYYSGGEGTAASPWVLKTVADLKYLSGNSSHWASHFILGSDIDASSVTSPTGNSTTPFSGSFDGKGYSIKNLAISQSAEDEPTGLFGVVDGATVQNLGVIDADIHGTILTGALAGLLKSGSVERCFSTGSVAATSVCAGGLVGENESGSITDCYSAADVSNPGDYATGGLVGKNRGTISNTYATGHVNGLDYVGGLVGANYGQVSKSVAINGGIISDRNYSARFGGNNNPQNTTTYTYAWDGIPNNNGWTSFGHHSTTLEAKEIAWEKNFKKHFDWDFDNTWNWLIEEKTRSVTNASPVLKSLHNQRAVLPVEMTTIISATESIADDAVVTVSVSPNPTQGILTVSAGAAITSVGIYSLKGSMLLSIPGNGNSLQADISAFVPGLYILRADISGQAPVIIKIIKK